MSFVFQSPLVNDNKGGADHNRCSRHQNFFLLMYGMLTDTEKMFGYIKFVDKSAFMDCCPLVQIYALHCKNWAVHFILYFNVFLWAIFTQELFWVFFQLFIPCMIHNKSSIYSPQSLEANLNPSFFFFLLLLAFFFLRLFVEIKNFVFSKV